jgi:serine protease Do
MKVISHVFLTVFLSLSAGIAVAYTLPQNKPIEMSENIRSINQLSTGIAEITDYASDALVFIHVKSTAVRQSKSSRFGPFPGRPFPHGQAPQREGLGSGFLIDLDQGFIMTNNHVVRGAGDIDIKLANGQEYKGTVVGSDANTDIAVVKISNKSYDRTGLTALSFADSDKLRVGSFVVAIGAPFGLEASTSFGVVSAIGRGNLGITPMGNFIQSDAAINPGNSGGPLLNTNGQVIGVNTAIASQNGGSNGIGFAVPSSIAKEIGTRLIETGKVNRGYIGAALGPVDREYKQVLEQNNFESGVLVAEVVGGSPAEKAGLLADDVIVMINKGRVSNASQVVNRIGLLNPGATIDLEVIRGGSKKNINITVGTWPST